MRTSAQVGLCGDPRDADMSVVGQAARRCRGWARHHQTRRAPAVVLSESKLACWGRPLLFATGAQLLTALLRGSSTRGMFRDHGGVSRVDVYAHALVGSRRRLVER